MSADPDKAAKLESAYLKHKQSLLGVAINITHCQASAEDAIQAAFSRLVQTDWHTEKLEAYVFRAVRNAALDIYRKQKRESEKFESAFLSTSLSATYHNGSPHHNHVEQLILREEQQNILEEIEKLPPEEREIIVLKNFSNFTFEEIAEITETNSNTVATRYRRLIQKLRNQLKERA